MVQPATTHGLFFFQPSCEGAIIAPNAQNSWPCAGGGHVARSARASIDCGFVAGFAFALCDDRQRYGPPPTTISTTTTTTATTTIRYKNKLVHKQRPQFPRGGGLAIKEQIERLGNLNCNRDTGGMAAADVEVVEAATEGSTPIPPDVAPPLSAVPKVKLKSDAETDQTSSDLTQPTSDTVILSPKVIRTSRLNRIIDD